MPESPTTQEFVVTGQVRERFTGDSYSNYEYQGLRVWTFGSAPHERWVDSDDDGWWDYGTRNENDGSVSRWNGFGWENDRNPQPPSEFPGIPEIEPENQTTQSFFDEAVVSTDSLVEFQMAPKQDPVEHFYTDQQDWFLL